MLTEGASQGCCWIADKLHRIIFYVLFSRFSQTTEVLPLRNAGEENLPRYSASLSLTLEQHPTRFDPQEAAKSSSAPRKRAAFLASCAASLAVMR